MRPTGPAARGRTGDEPSLKLRRATIIIPAILAYLPLLLTQQGQVGADTKTYLYLDPGRLLERAPYLWDPNIGAGTVTHQNIGYLWPMGPWYWTFETLGVPDWVAQRLWLGTVMFAAALGIRYLLRTLGWTDRAGTYGILIASLAYMLSPYLLDYAARISVILLPWAGLGWLIALTARSLRHGGWRYPALVALVVVTVGGINATALIMVAPGPLLWILYAWGVEREVSGARTLATLGRLGALGAVTSLWWIAGLWAQGRYGLPVIRFTETYRTVAESSSAPETFRGLGYWFFYGWDKLGPWIEPSVEYTNRTALLALSYILPALALTAAAVIRFRHRAYFLMVLVVGTLVAVGAHPWDTSSPLGAVFKDFTRSDAGLALRSTPRAIPLVVLALAVFLGGGIASIVRRAPARAVPAALVAGLLIILNLPPLWNGTMIADNLKRPEAVPEYWEDAADYLDASDDGTRVLELPGSDFASYRWGNTVDPITPGLTDRPYLARELFQYGSPESAALLIALDRRLQDDTVAPDALTTVAAKLAAGQIVLRSDLQFERYRTARPVPTSALMNSIDGLSAPTNFGPATPNVAGPEQPLLDEITLAMDPSLPDPSPVAVYDVTDALPIVRTQPTTAPLVISGGPEGLVDAAGSGFVGVDQAVFYAASLAADSDLSDLVLADGAELLVTDTNRKRARRWGVIQQNTGYTELVDEVPLSYDPTDQRMEVFPGAPVTEFTISEQRGDVTAQATSYGNPVTFIPEDRPAQAVDGDPFTAWRVGSFSDVRGERLILDYAQPVTTDRITLLQPVTGIINRSIREVDLIMDGGPPVRVALGPESEAVPGQVISFPERTFTRLEIEIVGTDIGEVRRYDGLSGVGFAEVDVDGRTNEELIRPASGWIDALGSSSLDYPLAYLFTRLRSNPREKVRFDEEPSLRRVFDLATPRSFTLAGEGRLNATLPDEEIDTLIGLPGPESGGIEATSDARLTGAVDNRASSAFDGDPTTFWTPTFEEQQGHYIEVTLPDEITIDQLDITVVADGRHSVPTRAFLQADGRDDQVREILFGDIADKNEENAVTEVSVDFPELTGTTFRLALDGVREEETVDWHSGFDIILPVAIAEIDIPGADRGTPSAGFDSGCRDDLLTVDGLPIDLRLTGSTDDLLALAPLRVESCGDSELDLDEGEHILRARPGRDTGFNLDWVSLRSAAGGSAAAASAVGPADGSQDGPVDSPELAAVSTSRVSYDVAVTAADEPYWLVLGQSYSDGWQARVEGFGDLGAPVVIDGYANGWWIDPAVVGSDITVRLEWAPQRVIFVALALSALGVLACLALLVVGRRRETPWAAPPVPETSPGLGQLRTVQRPVPWRMAAVAGVGIGAFAFLNSPPPGLVALLPATLMVISLRWARGRLLLPIAAAASFWGVAAFYVVEQYRFRYAPGFAWPSEFESAHVLGLLVVFLLAAEVVRTILIRPGNATPGPEVDRADLLLDEREDG